MKINTLLRTIIWVSVGLYALVNLFYFLKFNGDISSDPAVWGQYGDFIGGSMNPIFGLVNIIALVYLTYEISHTDERRAKEALNAQKLITLTQMRLEAVNQLSNDIDDAFNNKVDAETKNRATKVHNIVMAFSRHTSFLFKGKEDAALVELREHINTMKDVLLKYNHNNTSEEEREKVRENIRKFINIKNKLIYSLKQFIIEDLSKVG